MENEIKVKLDNIEKSNEEIKELIKNSSIENKRINNELLNKINELKGVTVWKH